MKRLAVVLAPFTALGGVVAHMALASGQSNGEGPAERLGVRPPWQL